MSKRLLLPALVFAAAIAAFAAAVVPANATAPGSDGRLSFTSFRSGGTDNVFTVKPDGTDIRQLTFLTADQGGDGEASWSPNGETLVFTEHSPDFSVWRIWVMNADGSNRHLLFNETSGHNDFQASFSADGSQVIFRRCNNNREDCAVYSVKPDGHGLNALTHNVSSKAEVFDVKPEYSPDGSSISFSSFLRGGVQNGVYIKALHGSKFQLITPTALEAVDADWAPDSSKLVFYGPCCVAQLATIYQINPDGTGLQQLTNTGTTNDLRPSFAPQGDRIAFERDAVDFSSSDVYTMNSNGTGQTLLVSDAGTPNWGPAP